MKKNKLLVSVATLLLAGSAVSFASLKGFGAFSSTASELNADAEEVSEARAKASATDAEPVVSDYATTLETVAGQGTECYLYNVEAQAWFLGANNYGTRASISATKGYRVKIEAGVTDGTYRIVDRVENQSNAWKDTWATTPSDIWVDYNGQGDDTKRWVFTATTGGYNITNLNVDGGSSKLGAGTDTRLYFESANQDMYGYTWLLLTAEDYDKYVADHNAWAVNQYGAGDDVTHLAPGSWTCVQGNGPTPNQTGIETYGNTSFAAGKVIYQKVVDLKPGKYDVEFYYITNLADWNGQTGYGEGIAQLYANDQTYDVSVVLDRGGTLRNQVHKFENVVVTDGTLEYGIKNVATGGCWYVAELKNITCVEFGVDLSVFAEELAKEVVAAKAVTGVMNRDVQSELNDAISDNEGASYTSETDYQTAIKRVQNAVKAANASIVNYEIAAPYVNRASCLDAAGKAKYAEDATVAAVTDAYNTRTLVALTDEQKTAMDAAAVAAAKAQTTVGSDWTLAIVNPSFETGNTTGWTYTESNDHGAKQNSNPTYTMKGCDGNYLFNIWSTGNEISQTVTGLKPGKYNVTAIMATDANQMFFIALNGTKGELVSSVDKGTGVKVTTDAYVGQDGELEIVAGTQGKFWYKVDDFRLTYVSEETVDPAVIEAQKLAAAKEAKTAAIKALSPIGDGLFQYSSTNVAAALQAVEDAKTIVELDNVALPVVKAPAANRAFQLTSPAGKFVTIDNGVQLASVQEKLYFEQAENGDFYITDGSEYIVNSGANYWDFSSYSNASDTYKVLLAEGGIVIKSDNGFFGFDHDVDGGLLYRDKAATVFGLADYVEPTPVIADLTVNDGVAVEASQDAKNITYVREFKAANKWQSLYLPFSVNLENNKADVVLAKVDDVVENNGELVINIVKVSATETVEACIPLFIAAKTVGVKNIKTGVSTVASPNDRGNDYSAAEFTGILSEASAGKAGKYVMSGGELCLVPQSMDNLTLGVNRWAMSVNDGANVRIRINAEGFNADEATAIASAVAESVENGEIFSINGAKVKDAKSGLYIKGGKKVYVK